jgi:Ca2+-binding RTX toxin-like protein
MAAPQISGMVALAQQLAVKELGRRLSFDEIRFLLKNTGDPIIDGDNENDVVPNTGLTFYRADMLALAEAILALKPPVSHTVTIASGTVVDGKNFGFSTGAAVQGLAADDFIVGAGNGEIIRGGAGADQIDAGDGDDQVYGEAGDDRLTGGPGNDTIDGGEGTDTAVFIGRRADYTVTWSATTSSFAVTSVTEGTDSLVSIETLTFLDGSFGASALQNPSAPSAPTLTSVSPLTGASEDAAFTITYAALAAAADEADAQGDPIAFRVESVTSGTLTKNGVVVVAGSTQLAPGEQLVWTPARDANGTLAAFKMRAADATLASTNDVPVSVTVAAVNDAPVLVNAIADQRATTSSAFSLTVPADAFTDVDSAALTYTATRADGSALPAWLSFNAGTRTFSGTPASGDLGTVSVKVTASDGSLSASDTLEVTVAVPVGVTALGTEGRDSLSGSLGDDVISGLGGHDTLYGGAGNDRLDGGQGIDLARFDSARSGAALNRSGQGFVINSAADGTDQLVGVERLQFAGSVYVALDLDANAGLVAKILGAVFGRASTGNAEYVGIGLHYLDGGMSYQALMRLAIEARLGAAASNQDVVKLLYTNVVGVAPNNADLSFYLGMLDRGEQTWASLGVLAAETDLNRTNINLVGLTDQGLTYIPFGG